MERGLEDFLVELFEKNSFEIPEKVDVGYYSGGGPNHSKNHCVFNFSGQFFSFHCRTTTEKCGSRR